VLADLVAVEPAPPAAGDGDVDEVVDSLVAPVIGDELEQRDQLRAMLRRDLRPEDGHAVGRSVSELAREYGPQVPGLTVERAEEYIEEFFAEVDRWLRGLSLEELRRVTGPGEYAAKLMVREREADTAAFMVDGSLATLGAALTAGAERNPDEGSMTVVAAHSA
jgi:hypothetical protein